MPLISLREFAHRNGVDVAAISRAVKAGRLPSVDGKIDLDPAQPVWDRNKGPRARRCQQAADGKELIPCETLPQVNTQVDSAVDLEREVNSRSTSSGGPQVNTQMTVAVDFGREVNSRAPTPRHALKRQEYTIKGMPVYPEPPINGRDRLAITVWINGAEEVVLDAKRAEKGLSLPAYLLTAVGYPPAKSRTAKPSRRGPVHNWFERRSVTVVVSAEVFQNLYWRAIHERLSIPQYIRTVLGFGVRQYSNPGTAAWHREEDEAWHLLRKAGLDPRPYFLDEREY
jgi:hypothetical protein